MKADFRNYLERTNAYLEGSLLQFWIDRIYEPGFGGFRTSFDRDGEPTSETQKTLLCQARTIFTLSFAARLGHRSRELLAIVEKGFDFLFRVFRDAEHDGYFWISSHEGTITDDSKVLYGLSFLIYGFSEYARAGGKDRAARDEAGRIADLVLAKAADVHHGGFLEHFDRAFTPTSVRPDGVIDKSLDVHMHLMEAFTNLYALTGSPRHRQLVLDISELIFDRMIDPGTGCGISMFTADWRPLANVQLQTVWGSDRFSQGEKPTTLTSYGHNIELAWLYLLTLDTLGLNWKDRVNRVAPIWRHTIERGIDREYGGLYIEGYRDGEATDTDKEFWQQAEALVGFIDAYVRTHEPEYWDQFEKLYSFVFEKMVHKPMGEWFPLLSREGEVKRDYMGHSWKICYHTVRSMCVIVEKLKILAAERA